MTFEPLGICDKFGFVFVEQNPVYRGIILTIIRHVNLFKFGTALERSLSDGSDLRGDIYGLEGCAIAKRLWSDGYDVISESNG